jgi:putative addiction module component (TIGR02574 family)
VGERKQTYANSSLFVGACQRTSRCTCFFATLFPKSNPRGNLPGWKLAFELEKIMTPTIQDLGIDRLSGPDRLRLIGEIWDSLSHAEQTELADSHREVLDHRIAEADANPGAGRPWEEVLARLRDGK